MKNNDSNESNVLKKKEDKKKKAFTSNLFVNQFFRKEEVKPNKYREEVCETRKRKEQSSKLRFE